MLHYSGHVPTMIWWRRLKKSFAETIAAPSRHQNTAAHTSKRPKTCEFCSCRCSGSTPYPFAGTLAIANAMNGKAVRSHAGGSGVFAGRSLMGQRIPRKVCLLENNMDSNHKHRSKIEQLIKAVEARDVRLRNAERRLNPSKNVQILKPKTNRKKLK